MVPIISIRMGDMLGHGSWSMSWLAACGSRGVPTYLHTYIPYTLGRKAGFPSFYFCVGGMTQY